MPGRRAAPGRRRRARLRLPLRHRAQVPAGAARHRVPLRATRSWLERLEPPFLDVHAARWAPGDARRDRATTPAGSRAGSTASPTGSGLGAAVDYALALGVDAIAARVIELGDLAARAARRRCPGSRCTTRASSGAASSRSPSTASTRTQLAARLRTEAHQHLGVDDRLRALRLRSPRARRRRARVACTTTTPRTSSRGSSTRCQRRERTTRDCREPAARSAAGGVGTRRRRVAATAVDADHDERTVDRAGRQRRQRLADRLLVRVRGRPPRGLELVVGDHPRMHEVGHDARGHVADARAPTCGRARARAPPPGTRAPRARDERARVVGVEPAVGRDVVDAREIAAWPRARARSRGRRRARPAPASPRPAPAAADGPSRMRAGRRSAPGPTTGADRSVVTVTLGVARRATRRAGARPRRPAPRARSAGSGAAARPRSAGPGCWPTRRRRWRSRCARSGVAPTAAAASSTWRVPSTLTRAISADVGDGVDDAGEVHDHVDALEQRLELGAGDVDPGELDVARAPIRLAHVESEHRDRRRDVRRAPGGAGCPTRPDAPVTAIGMHAHTLTAWPTIAQPEEPEEPDELPRIPGFPGFLVRWHGAAISTRPTFDFSQIDLGQVMRMLQSTGPVNWEIARQTAEWVALEGRPDRRRRRRRPRAVRGARARRADTRRRRDRSHRDVRHHARDRRRQGLGRSPPRRAASRARGPGRHAGRCDAAGRRRRRRTDDDVAGAGGFPGMPRAGGPGRDGQHDAGCSRPRCWACRRAR